ncbi:hypothetical protein A9Q84_19195 [Halobacteriovorax marinus]|uniref:SGNH hydrolase-type esterase domain-containing protein n=1 Tax=Halobacteriovorax marinus TaxID=97084 RepID=A0A1Y5F2C5_9BACT|nr:hypothetical protein A9Q84_19195 [Halobacteriovorax marinus]
MNKTPLKDKLSAKILLSFVSLLLSLGALEGGLRLAGVALNYQKQADYTPYDEKSSYIRDESYEAYSSKKSSETILCIGDSFTNAGNVKSYHSYPYNLYELFKLDKSPARVLNMGLCEDSTFGVHDRFKNFLIKNKGTSKFPDKVVILIGAADKFERFEIEQDDRYDQDWFEIREAGWLKKTRLFKVYRHIKLSFIQKYLSNGLSSENSINDSEFEAIKEKYLFFKEKIKLNPNDPKLQELVTSTISSLPQSFKNYCEGLSIKFENAQELTHSLLVYMSKILITRHRHDLALKWLLDLAKAEPVNFWSGKFDDAYFRIIQTYQIQSKYSEKEVLKVLDDSQKNFPEITKFKKFTEFYTLVSDSEKVASYVDTKRLATWKKIIDLCKEHKIKLYIMNYPSEYESANKSIQQVVSEHHVNFIDTNHYFKKLIERDGRGKYLEDDDHLTPLGYKLMAKQIYKYMKENK